MQTTFLTLIKTPNAPKLESKKQLSPVLKWAGGKRWFLPYFKYLWKNSAKGRLVEPFAGGLAIALGIGPERALINDINPHVINFYNWIKMGIGFDIKMSNVEKDYYNYRQHFNQLIKEGKAHTHEVAQIFYYLNKTGFNGLCRFNSRGEYNVPYGKYKVINYHKDLTDYKMQFNNWQFSVGDFENLVLEDNDFVYADPPYDVEFTKYSKEDFIWADQIRLAEWLAKHKGPVVLSNQATARVINLYKKYNFKLQFLNAPRMISCDGNRARSIEILATRNI